MVLLDFSGTVFQSIAVNLTSNHGVVTDRGYLRHLIINTIRSYNKKFCDEYGDMVICLDSKEGTWRKDIFPHYKEQRKQVRLDSGIDWKRVFDDVNVITSEIKEYLPYRCIYVRNLEADDVIAILAMNAEQICHTNPLGMMDENILIVSNDKDYAQLHKLPYVIQYKPRTGAFVKDKNPDFSLTELILKGDKADGIPNIKSSDDTFVSVGKRQKSVTTDFIRTFLHDGVSCLTEDEKKRYEMNKKLISFDEIPTEYIQIVIDAYNESKHDFSKFKLFEYFTKYGLKELTARIDDF